MTINKAAADLSKTASIFYDRAIFLADTVSYITRFVPNTNLAQSFQRPIATLVVSQDRQNQCLRIWAEVGETVPAD
jgi:hypothetical protein